MVIGFVFATVLAAASAQAQPEPTFGTRAIRTCAQVNSKPTVEQAAALVQCHLENKSVREIYLLEHVVVQMGGSQAYNYPAHHLLTSINTETRPYPIRGSYITYDCSKISVIPAINSDNRGKNCFTVNKPAATGYCWQTTFGNWDCVMGDANSTDPVQNQAPPKP
jgi:hypothetical protein